MGAPRKLTAVLAAGQVMGAHEAGALSQVTAVNPKCWEGKMAFQVGDVVQLRYGGGPHMRVEKTAISNGNEWVTCVWGASNECHNYFAAEMLQRAEAKGEPGRSSVASVWEWLTSRLRR
ncbi:MAG TPA: DUF2158 domain-containing protein [Bradyrhizobium sp.]|nr:DUF2158 domain-containing protein [Bradyrhizobium sp.]